MARWPAAIWEPVAQCSGTLQPIAVCLHHQAGLGDPAPIYAARDVSAHFWIPYTGQPIQHVDTNVRAWHGITHNDYSIGVETEGCATPPHADPLNNHQMDLFASLMTWANQTHGIPLVLSEAVDQPGLNYHRCAGGPATACPCQTRVDARAEILEWARADNGGTAPTPPTPAPGAAPPFPYPPGDYLGQPSSDPHCHSGYYGGLDHETVKTWQAGVGGLTVDGLYGPASENAARQLQTRAGLDVDGLVGPQTWAATFS
jgi:peptidoglycan hydrolase-like protein with peptidoglycan-binding domain